MKYLLSILLIVIGLTGQEKILDRFWLYSTTVKDSFEIKILIPDNRYANESYPVLYMTDGDRNFGIMQEYYYNYLDDHDVKVAVISVGYGSVAKNNKKRKRDFKFKQNSYASEKFTEFLEKELFSLVEEKYNLNSNQRTLLGWSRGAMYVLDTFFKKENTFNRYIALSPRVKDDDWSAIELLANKNKSAKSKLFMSMGTSDKRFSAFEEFANNAKKISTVHVQTLDEMDHDAFAKSMGLGYGLKYIFVKKPIVKVFKKALEKNDFEHAEKLFKELYETKKGLYNFSVNQLNEFGYNLFKDKKFSLALKVFKLNYDYNSNSEIAAHSLGEASLAAGNIENAKKYLSIAVEIGEKYNSPYLDYLRKSLKNANEK